MTHVLKQLRRHTDHLREIINEEQFEELIGDTEADNETVDELEYYINQINIFWKQLQEVL
ncbi:MAG: hypothetical protein ACRC68_16800 [Clostridium sp.]